MNKLVLDLFSKGWTEDDIATGANIPVADVHAVLVEEGVIVEDEPTTAAMEQMIGTMIPYKEFDYMLKCKNVVETIFAAAESNINDPSRMFINSKYVLRALCTNLPEKVKQRTKELTEATNIAPEFI